jgi:uncharacterized coiled-coil protein SlyX
MSEKKVVGRTVAIALGIICIILAVGLVGAIANYTSIISGKDNTIVSLNSQITTKDNTISSLNSQIASKDSQISSLNSEVTNLQYEVKDLSDIVILVKSTVLVRNQTVYVPAGSYHIFSCSATFAGYLSVDVQTANTTNAYVRVIYYSYGVNFDQQIDVGTGGTAVFPILPSRVEIYVGNTNLINRATETVTITYHY